MYLFFLNIIFMHLLQECAYNTGKTSWETSTWVAKEGWEDNVKIGFWKEGYEDINGSSGLWPLR